MLKGIKVFCVELEGTRLIDGVVYEIDKYIIEDGEILIKVNNYDEYHYMSRFEKVDDVIKVSMKRNIEIKEAIRVFI